MYSNGNPGRLIRRIVKKVRRRARPVAFYDAHVLVRIKLLSRMT